MKNEQIVNEINNNIFISLNVNYCYFNKEVKTAKTAKTKVYRSYEEFLLRKDKSINGVTKSFLKEKEMSLNMAIEDNQNNKGCFNCYRCNRCDSCVNCIDCEDLYHCKDTYHCYDSSHLDDCYCCQRCKHCKSCNDCSDLEYQMGVNIYEK
jgi:hypothetical protein